MRLLDIFSGVGGFSLGFQRANFTPVMFCENDTRCRSIVARQWPGIPIHDDIRTLRLPRGFADVICGGFPCQPFSSAARGRNNATDLWPQFLRVVREVHPDWVAAENVPGIGHDGIDRVCGDLEDAGYAVWAFDLDTALPTRQRGRHRIIWLAHANDAVHPRLTVNAEVAGVREISGRRWQDDPAPVGMDDVLSGRMDRFRQLGNAITPIAAELIGRAIMRAATS